jgi:hypothetical protein
MCPDGMIAWTVAPGWALDPPNLCQALDTWFPRTALAARA